MKKNEKTETSDEKAEKRMTEAEIMELKQLASKETGVPVDIITGTTVEEIANSAMSAVRFAEEHRATAEARKEHQDLPMRERFAMWFNGEEPAGTVADPVYIERGYPTVKDAGEPAGIRGGRNPEEAFKEWFYDAFAYNPYNNNDVF